MGLHSDEAPAETSAGSASPGIDGDESGVTPELVDSDDEEQFSSNDFKSKKKTKMAKEHIQGINEEIIANEDDDETDAADESLSLPPSIEKALDEAEKRLLEAKPRASHDFVKALSDSIEVNGHGKMQAQALQMFRDVQAAPALCPLGAAMMDAAPGKEQFKPTRDPAPGRSSAPWSTRGQQSPPSTRRQDGDTPSKNPPRRRMEWSMRSRTAAHS